MDVFDAAYRVAHDFKPDGAVGLARIMGENPGTFLNRLNPNQETHELKLGQAVRMSVAARDRRICEAFADTLGAVVVPLPPKALVCDVDLLTLLLDRDSEQGRFAAELARALEDGRIDRREAEQLRVWALRSIVSLMGLVSRLEAMADD